MVPNGAYVYLARNIKDNVKAKVFVSNRINDPILAERILQDNHADAVCVGRGHITDPEFVLKIQEDRIGEIRKCIGCNQGCFDNIFRMKPVGCLFNPLAGKEKRAIPQTTRPKKIIIIGGGPSGLEALYRAHLAGHDVKLFEKLTNWAGNSMLRGFHGKADIKNIIDYYCYELKRIGRNIHEYRANR